MRSPITFRIKSRISSLIAILQNNIIRMIIDVLQEKISTKDRVVRNPNIKHKYNS